MINYPKDIVELRYARRRVDIGPGMSNESTKLQYRIKIVSPVDYSVSWTDWIDVPYEEVDK